MRSNPSIEALIKSIESKAEKELSQEERHRLADFFDEPIRIRIVDDVGEGKTASVFGGATFGGSGFGGFDSEEGPSSSSDSRKEPLKQSLVLASVSPVSHRVEGVLIRDISIYWFVILEQISRDPAFLYKIPWRKVEELIAGGYKRAGYSEVVLTPRSGDDGRDVIATKPGVGSIRIVDQVKAYKPGHLVTADEVRSMLGTIQADQNVSKGILTTTSDFAPGVQRNPKLQAFMPYRLELKNGSALLEWLSRLGTTNNS
jgi:restriction system protein